MSRDRCEACGQILPSQENKIAADRATPKKLVDVPKEWFSNLCYVLLRHQDLPNHPGFKEALIDLPKALERYGKLTEGQYKFFGVIHQKLMGTWPSREEAKTPLKEETFEIPFGDAPPF